MDTAEAERMRRDAEAAFDTAMSIWIDAQEMELCDEDRERVFRELWVAGSDWFRVQRVTRDGWSGRSGGDGKAG